MGADVCFAFLIARAIMLCLLGKMALVNAIEGRACKNEARKVTAAFISSVWGGVRVENERGVGR